MKHVKYVGPFDAVELERAPRVWVVVAHGESIEVPDDVAAALCALADNWAEESAPRAAKKELD